jgi:hypothetical protein
VTRMFRTALLIGAVAIAGTEPAEAQVSGMPVVNSGVISGLSLAADVGIPNDAAGGGHAFGATVGLGLGPLGITARLSRFTPDGSEELWSGGATANYKVFGGPLVPLAVTLQAGAGYSNPELDCIACDVSEWRFPVGLGFSFTIPNPALAIKPWIAPRVDITRRSADGASETETDFGVSGGVELNLLTGLGFQAAYDLMKRDPESPGIFSAGLHYNFRIPGL